MSHALPLRRPELVVRSVAGEAVVLDPRTDTAVSLTPIASRVFLACDGVTPVATLEAELGADVVDAALTDLLASDLLVAGGASRRVFLQRAGLVGVGAVAASIAVPAAVMAVSGGSPATGTFYGGALTARSNIDSYATFYFAETTIALPAGQLQSYSFYAQQTGTVYFLILDGTDEVLHTSANFTATTAGQTYVVNDSFTVPASARLGLGIVGGSVVPFSDGGGNIAYAADGTPKPMIGDSLPQQGTSPRTYSFGATIA